MRRLHPRVGAQLHLSKRKRSRRLLGNQHHLPVVCSFHDPSTLGVQGP
jgi:hypothetical protein